MIALRLLMKWSISGRSKVDKIGASLIEGRVHV
jgi:hypothetical protein